MKMHSAIKQEFIAMIGRAGLDPAQYDIEDLYEAWLLLNTHMKRLRSADRAADQQGLCLFDPTLLAGIDAE